MPMPLQCRAFPRRRIAAGEVESDSGLTDSEDEDEEP